MPEKSTKTIIVEGQEYNYEGRLRIAGKTDRQLAEVVAEKFLQVPAAEQRKIVDFLLNNQNSGKGKPVAKSAAAVVAVAEFSKSAEIPRTVITLAQLKEAKTYGGMNAADLAEVVTIIQGVIKALTDKGSLVSAMKLGITPEELKKRFSELDQFEADHK